MFVPVVHSRKIAMAFRGILKIRVKYFLFGALFCLFLELMGVYTHLFEKDYFTEFSYPLDEDILPYVQDLRKGLVPKVKPINEYNYRLLKNPKEKCEGSDVKLLLVIKSAMEHFDSRKAIRNSWGFENRFSDIVMRRVFVLGMKAADISGRFEKSILQKKIDHEANTFGDIVQANFVDTYFNNTIKTMVAFKWTVFTCPNASFVLFVDDDMYVSTKNVLRFARHPTKYPEFLEQPFLDEQDLPEKKTAVSIGPRLEVLPYWFSYELPKDAKLLSGYVFHSPPHRHKLGKWYVSLEEYPYHLWPPYVTAGAYIVSKEALHLLYYGSLYTKHFRFDDVYLGLVCKKVGISPLHNPEIYFWKKHYTEEDYKYVIASHGYKDPKELFSVWHQQKEAGNA